MVHNIHTIPAHDRMILLRMRRYLAMQYIRAEYRFDGSQKDEYIAQTAYSTYIRFCTDHGIPVKTPESLV